MTAKEILDRLSKGYQTYLNGDVTPVEGYDDKFYNGVLWAYARLTEIQPSDDNAPTVSFMISPDYVTELQNHNKELIKQLEEVERSQGEWIRTGSLGNGNAQYECSNCHHGDEQAESQEVPYCWHCGAKMMKGDKE